MMSLLVAVLALTMTIISALLYFWFSKKQKEDIDKLVNGQREMLENRVYDVSKPFVSDPVFFEDASKILIDTSNPDMKGATHVPDFSFFSNMDIDLSGIKVEDNTVAVLMPFNSRFDRVYASIKDACQREG